MTVSEFNDALRSLGIRLDPSPDYEGEIQWKGADDPFERERRSVTRSEGIALAEWAEGKRVLEIGTGLGVSTVCLASSAALVVTVDPSEWVRSALTLPANVARFTTIEDPAILDLAPFDLVFVDGLHDFDSEKKDIEDALRLLGPGGEIAVHDLGQPEVARAMDEFKWASRRTMETIGFLTFAVPA